MERKVKNKASASGKRRSRRFLLIAFAAAVVAVHAKTTAWMGTESGSLSAAAKWNNGLPEAGDSIVISNVAGAVISVVNDLDNLAYGALCLHGANVVDNFITNTSSTAKLAVINSTCSCTFNGDVVRTQSAYTYLTEGPGTLTLNGRLVVPSTVYFRPRSSQAIRCNGPVEVTRCDGTYENPFYGVNYLSSTENKIGTLNIQYYSFILEKDNVLSPNTVLSFTGREDRGDLRLNGHSQQVGTFYTRSGDSGTIESPTSAMWNFMAPSGGTTNATVKFTGFAGLGLYGGGTYAINCAMTSKGDIDVSGGTLD